MTRALLAALALTLAAGEARAQRIRIDVNAAQKPIPVAVQRFAGGAGPLADDFYGYLVAGLEYSSVVRHVNPEAFVEPRETKDFEAPAVPCENWKAVGAEGLVQGELRESEGRAQVRYRVWDTTRCKLLGDVAFRDRDRAELSTLAHLVADDIVQRFTGRRGVSSTEIAYVSDNGRKNKEIWVMSADGSNKRRVTSNGSINLFPSWSPDGKTLVYTSFKGGLSELYLLFRGTRPGVKLIQTRDEKFRGVWAPNDGTIAVVVSREGNTDLYTVSSDGKNPRRVTEDRSIESSPSWSPDGKKLAFVSDRTGSPQIFVKDLGSGDVRRLTYSGDYNASPAWSPTGEWIAYAAQAGNDFDIYLITPDGSFTQPLVTNVRSDEDPAWSPDGRKVAFSSNRRGRKEVYRVDLDGSNTTLLTDGAGNCTNPAWSPWLE
ncbi:MAG: Tol-Pal system beta propeller repeat protein TolB [Myxococcota bacterium]